MLCRRMTWDGEPMEEKGPGGWGKEANRMKMRKGRKRKKGEKKELKVDVKDKR